MVVVVGVERGGGKLNGNRDSGEPSIFLKYQTDTFSLDAEDHSLCRVRKKSKICPEKV